MNSKTLDTALLSLSAGCLVIGIYEVVARGIDYAYLWIMLSVVLWLSYSILKRRRSSSQDTDASTKKTAKDQTKTGAGKTSGTHLTSSKPRRKRR